MRHKRPRPRWRSLAIITVYFLGVAAGAYAIMQASLIWAAVAFGAAAIAITYNLIIEDRNNHS